MFKAIAIKALVGVGALGVVGGAAAVADAPTLTANLAAATTPKAGRSGASGANAARADKQRARGTIIKLSGTEMTVERQRRDPNTKAVTKDDVTVELNDKTVVHYLGSKDKHLIDVLMLGQDVGVRFVDNNGQKVARGVVILPDHRAGRIVSKDPDSRSFTIHTRGGMLVKVTTSEKTKFVEGTRRNRQPGSYADLKVGDRVLVLGQEDSQHVFDAAMVRSAHFDPHARPNTATATPAA